MTDKIVVIKNAKLADEIHLKFPIRDKVKNAIASTNREAFVPTGFKHNAYKLDALPIGASQWISSPLTVAKMTEYLECDSSVDSVLEVGCGSGYQAAVLSKIFRRVFTIERIESLMIDAKNRFRTLKINNVHTRTDDGQNGWIQYAPYDRIIFSASAKVIPQKIFDQLANGGILVAPLDKNGKQVIMRYFKRGGEIFEDELEECEFVPILNGVEIDK
jgi:protein-L-isoaspartate(D-aspartate) O-methyltransferase